jgi:hypothetical protein
MSIKNTVSVRIIIIIIIIIIITMARQPYMGLGLLFPRLLGRAHSWQLVTGQLANNDDNNNNNNNNNRQGPLV